MDLEELKVELIDRFGPLPPFTLSLLRIRQLRLFALRAAWE